MFLAVFPYSPGFAGGILLYFTLVQVPLLYFPSVYIGLTIVQLNLVIFQEKGLWSLGGKCQKQNAIFKSFTTASDKPNRVYANS